MIPRIKQIMLAHNEQGAYAIVWHSKRQRAYYNLSQNTIERISRNIDKLVTAGVWWSSPVGTGEIGWVAGEVDFCLRGDVR